MTTKNCVGRPTLPVGEAKSKSVAMNLTKKEHDLFCKKVNETEMSVSNFMRIKLGEYFND